MCATCSHQVARSPRTSADGGDGHLFSPKLRAERKDVAEMRAKQPALFAEGRVQFDEPYATGVSQLDVGDATHTCLISHSG